MRPPAFASDDVLDPVAVDVREGQTVEFGKGHRLVRLIPCLTLFGSGVGLIHDDMHLPGDGACVALLLPPGETRTVREEAANDIGKTIAVDVIQEHIGTA